MTSALFFKNLDIRLVEDTAEIFNQFSVSETSIRIFVPFPDWF
ncbi:hypothetical protein ACPOL_1208 [Acidisarcina polymorpha]|uniref:Uncharacterized protein n=1 Tax=Acidisarcina polymorpha TaxID=2211140 RepID=A0A2Z5FVW5_9BACT|nr:hypothetical protein ACPOL_1208 [Acidisarcina polymorpha]